MLQLNKMLKKQTSQFFLIGSKKIIKNLYKLFF